MKTLLLLTFTLALIFCSCGTSQNLPSEMTARERFEFAKKLMEEGNLDKAIENFNILSYERGASFADSVQLLIGDCYFNKEQYISSADRYQDLIRFHSNSPLVAIARFKIANSFANLSPRSTLDQKYTNDAIISFQTFIEYYPTHPKVREAERKIIELRNKLAEKDYNVAQLYEKMSRLKSAIVYYNGILDNYHDSDYAELSHYSIINIYIELKKYFNANQEIEKYLIKYPNGQKRNDVLALKEKIKNF